VRRWIGALASVGAFVAFVPGAATGAAEPLAMVAAERAAAESLFVRGRLDSAEVAYARVLERAPRDTLALVRAAALALMGNRLDPARALIARARAAGAAPGRLDALEAEALYRRDDFAAAAPRFRAAGRESLALKLASFGERRPNRVDGPERAVVRFVQTDPLPFVELWVNGVGPLLFLIDTGGGELVLDPVTADSVGALRYGSEVGTFAGDRRSGMVHGRVDSVRLGEATLRDVPIRMLDLRRWSAAAMGRRVHGVLGTIVFYHFRATLDYPGGALVLERRGTPLAAAPPGVRRVEVPFRLAGDHLIIAEGAIDSSAIQSWLVDTGLAGAAFTGPASTLAEARVAIDDRSAFTGQGGGGSVRVTPFRVRRLSLGAAEATDLLGIQGAFPPSLERSQGFRIGGIVSHAFFRPWRLTFDFEAMRLSMERPAAP